MAIKTYTEDGKELFEVTYSLRSKKNPRIRVQRRYIGIESEVEAQLAFQKAQREVPYLLAQKEARGDNWAGLIDCWNNFHEKYPTGQYSESTRRDYVAKLNKWTEPWLNRPAVEITTGDVLHALLWMHERGASYKLRCDVKSVIHIVFKWAIEQRMLEKQASPVYGLKVPKYSGEEQGEKMPLIKTREEMAIALEIARQEENPWYPIWFVATHTGMRAGELNALRKEKIDLVSREKALEFDRQLDSNKIKPKDANYGQIFVHKAWNKHASKNLQTKGQYWRVVPVNRALYWFLAENMAVTSWGKDEDGERVFERMTELDRGNQASVIKAFFEAHQLGEMTFHTMRAVWATQMLRSGVDPARVMKIGGWKDLETMMIYVRLAGIDVAGATGGLDFEAPRIAKKEASNGNVVQLFNKK